MMRTVAFLTCVLTFMNLSATDAAGQAGTEQGPNPLTVAEKSDYKSTSKSAEVVEFVKTCSAAAPHVRDFVWGKTVEGRDMIGAIVAKQAYTLGDQDERNVVLLLGNIHSGECAGKEALLIMLRELTHNSDHPWLDKNVIIFAPNYNADANDRMGKNNRRGQIGPENGMGRRENAQQLDLNRDFCKIESPEARALVALINQANPHMFVDCHTTNGSKHQYSLTYDIPHNPATAEPIRQFLRQRMMPVVTERLKEKGQLTFYYGNFDREHTKWTTYGHEPRYSTEYVGMRGRLAILSEAYSYLDYKGRIFATKDFVTELMNYVTENSTDVHRLLDSVDEELVKAAKTQPARVTMSLSAKMGPFEEKFVIKGYLDDEPTDYLCDFISKYEPTKTTPLPFAYVIPVEQARVVDRLLMHGVSVEKLTADWKSELEIDTVTSLDRAERAFQKHKMVRVAANRDLTEIEVPAGTYIVRTSQPLGRWISYMLESESDDGFAFWNFFDADLEEGKVFPVMRVPNPIEIPAQPTTETEKVGLISLEMIDGPKSLLAETAKTPAWIGDTHWLRTGIYDDAVFIDAETGGIVMHPAKPYDATSVRAALVDAGMSREIADELAKADAIVSTNNQVAIFSVNDYSALYFIEGQKKTKESIVVLGDPETPAELFNFNDAETQVAFSTKTGLHFFEFDSRETKSVLTDNEQHLIGKLDWVYQEELYGRGNFKGYWWQTDGDQVAFLQLDETPLFPFTVMDHMPVRGKSEMTNYPKAGDPNPVVKIGVVNANQPEQITWVDLSKYADEEILISRVSWSSDGKQLLIQVQNREQTWLDLVATYADGSNQGVLFRDQTPAWIESPGDPVLLDQGEFLWRSPRSGYSHIYRYDGAGKLLGAVTAGEWEVRGMQGVSQDKKYCFFTATRDNAIGIQAYRANLETGEVQAVTETAGTHDVDFSDDFAFFIDSWSDVESPGRFFLRRNDGSLVRELNTNSDDRLKYLKVAKPEFLEVPSGNDQPLDAMLIKPPNFDAKKKYPVLVFTYAGPQNPKVRNKFGGEWYLWHQMLAQQGYVVWICDNQSASFRSTKNVWPIHRNFAENELADIERGVDWLRGQAWVDSERIGLWGWSYGGYMTAYALTHSQSFKMGISGAPVTDWANYDSIYTERYMGRPQTNPEGYESTSVLNNNAENLHGKLLLIHGTVDDNVHLNNTIQFVKELQYAGKQFELMLYPSNRHSIKDKKQAAHLRELMTEFVKENL
ncbi:MAG: dipeptidyl-peptidase-4 [Mariniblastus sp.]|jgi:dipeptidyl-peptidase-4